MIIPSLPHAVSIDQLIGQERDTTLEAFLVDPEAESQERTTYRKELVKLMRTALARLNERERHIIRSRFGVLGGDELTLEDIASRLRLSRERVRQLESIAKTKLRRFLTGYSPSGVVDAALSGASHTRPPNLFELNRRRA